MFEYGSSSIDWCESNYKVIYCIAEIMNTVSGLLFILFSLIQYYSIKRFINKYFELSLIILNFIIGIGTVIFHSTLNLFGQYVDELGILLLICLFTYYFSENYYVLIFGFLSLLVPHYNRYFLMFYSFYCSYYIIKNKRGLIDENHKGIITYCGVEMSIALIFWLIDIFLCNYLVISLHWIWHILSSIVLHNLITIIIYNRFNYDMELIDYKFIIFTKKREHLI